MPTFEPVSPLPRLGDPVPRALYREIADLLATALLRLRRKNAEQSTPTNSFSKNEIPLGFTDHQSVHDNPSQPSGAKQ